MKKNPFHEITALFNSTPSVVTIQLLDVIKKIMHSSGVEVKTYSNAFKILEYLHENNALELTTTKSGSHLVINKYVEE